VENRQQAPKREGLSYDPQEEQRDSQARLTRALAGIQQLQPPEADRTPEGEQLAARLAELTRRAQAAQQGLRGETPMGMVQLDPHGQPTTKGSQQRGTPPPGFPGETTVDDLDGFATDQPRVLGSAGMNVTDQAARVPPRETTPQLTLRDQLLIGGLALGLTVLMLPFTFQGGMTPRAAASGPIIPTDLLAPRAPTPG